MQDRFRKKYHSLLEHNEKKINEAKSLAEELEYLFTEFECREMSLALTRLEESIFWGVKGICLFDQEEQKEERASIE